MAIAIDAIVLALGVGRGKALDLLIQQPALLFDFPAPTMTARIEGLARTFQVWVHTFQTIPTRVICFTPRGLIYLLGWASLWLQQVVRGCRWGGQQVR